MLFTDEEPAPGDWAQEYYHGVSAPQRPIWAHPRSAGDLRIDFACRRQNNAVVSRPETPHRVKSYSAGTGVVYTYQFVEMRKSRRGFHAGTDYVYLVRADRAEPRPLPVFVRADAVQNWNSAAGRELSGTEQYAVAKLRLFQAFDEIEDLAGGNYELHVDQTNLNGLLEQLGI